MELEMFRFIDEAMKLYEADMPLYEKAESRLHSAFSEIYEARCADIVNIHTRIKEPASTREKLLRNKYYKNFSDPEDALNHMPDIVGITVECRFIRSEAELYHDLFHAFSKGSDRTYSPCILFPGISLNLNMMQPQLQRNGYTVYRLDGRCMMDGESVNFELQIKSLVHSFWSEIEHEIIYKNQEFIANDRFYRGVLATVRDSLDVVDRQMELITNEIHEQSENAAIGMDERGFKQLAAASINELVRRKMQESVGYSTDFRKDASILAQYIYIRYFITGENNEVKMVEFLENLNLLAQSDMDFRSDLVINGTFHGKDVLEEMLGQYWITRMNTDFEWHAFFTVLFAIQNDDNLSSLQDFVSVISHLMVQPLWYAQQFSGQGERQKECQDAFERALADGIIDADTIDSIYEDRLYHVMITFRSCIENAQGADLSVRLPDLQEDCRRRITRVFH